MATATKSEQEEAREYLRERVAPGGRLYTVLRHVSNSGMMRVIDVYQIKDNQPMRLSWHVARACGYAYDSRYEGVKVLGTGMDMGFDVVYNLSCALFCPEKYSHDAAYSLKQEWL